MTPISKEAASGPRLTLAGRIAWTALIVVTLGVCYFQNLGVLGLTGPDEPRYAWIARAMQETGDWVTPRLYGSPWFEKPVLYYWGAAASFHFLGVSDAAARLPSAIAALLATLAMAWLAWKFYGGVTARWMLLLLPTTVGMIGFSHAAATDMPFSGSLSIAMVFAAVVTRLVPSREAEAARGTPWAALVLFGFFLGLAVLAKGPAAIVLSGSSVLLWAAFTRRWADALRCLHPASIAAFCATALPWYVACARRNPDFVRVFLIEHNFKRYLTPEFQHLQPFWYYVPVLLVAFFPWALMLAWAAVRGARGALRGRLTPQTIFLVCWAGFTVAFFSVSKSKLPGYVLPGVPAIGLLLASAFARVKAEERKVLRWILLATGLAACLAALFFAFALNAPAHAGSNANASRAIAGVLLLTAIANLLLVLPKPGDAPSSFSAAGVVPILVMLAMFPKLEPAFVRSDPSGRTMARELVERGIPLEELMAAPDLSRGQGYSLNYYLRREVPRWDAGAPREGLLVTRSGSCLGIVKAPWVCSADPKYLPGSGALVFEVKRGASVSGLDRLGPFDGDGRVNGNGEPRQEE